MPATRRHRARLRSRCCRTLLDLLDARRHALRRSAGARRPPRRRHRPTTWTYRELDRRSPVAAWRLRALDLRARRPDPDLVAVDAGAAGGLLRRDARSARPRPARPADVARRDRDDRRGRRARGTSSSAPAATRPIRASSASATSRPRRSTPSRPSRPTTTRRSRPTGRRGQAAWQRPAPDELVRARSSRRGTTGTPKGVMLAHDNVLASIESFHRIVPPMEHRIVSLLPLSHLLEQAVGAVLRARRRRRRPVRPQPEPAGHLRRPARPPGHDHGRRPAGARPVLERHRARGRRSAGGPRRVRAASVRSPAGSRSRSGGSCSGSVHAQLGGHFRLFLSSGRVPAAGAAAGVGGHRRHRPAGLRRDRDRHRRVHDARRPRARDGRPGARRHRDAHRAGRRDPVPRPDPCSRATGTRPS